MKLLIAFATSEGQTKKIAEAAARRLRALGHEVRLFDTGHSPAGVEAGAFDRIVVAGSVHQQHHQESLEDFVAANLAELNQKPTLFLSVSLSAAFAEGIKEAQGYADAFLAETGWRPGRTQLVAGALWHEEYDYFRAQIIEHVVLKGRKVDNPGQDREFTDWAALDRAVAGFMAA